MTDSFQTHDLVIVGSGAGAMTAALKAVAMGKRPIIIEKQNKVGGSTAMSGGVLWIPGNPVQGRAGVKDSYDEAWTYLEALIGDRGGAGATKERRDAYLRTGPEMVSFLEDRGIRFQHCQNRPDYYDELPGGKKEGRSLEVRLFNAKALGKWFAHLQGSGYRYPMTGREGREVLLAQASLRGAARLAQIALRMAIQPVLRQAWVGLGVGLQSRLLQACLRANVPVLTEMPVKEFIVENRRVTGVIAMSDGRPVTIHARRGVLINSGGFALNSVLRSRYGQQPATTAWTHANPGDTGEVLAEAMRLGAAVDVMEEAWWVATSILPDGRRAIHVPDICKPGSIVVDQGAQRFVDEGVSYMEFGQAMYRRNRNCAAIPSWCIMDRRHRSRYAWAGVLPFQTPKSWFESGYMKRADTLAGLAACCGLDPDALHATIERFNAFARAGKDGDFGRGARAYDCYYADPSHKPNPSLGAIDKPPFYAVQLFPGDVGTAGGLVADQNARVLRADGTAIQGLFATGNATAPVLGRVYPGAGASIGASAIFGYIAAACACQELSKQTTASADRWTASSMT